MGVITYNGITSTSLGIVVETLPNYEFAEAEVEATHIPGRNGDAIISKGSYKNVDRSYSIAKGSLDGSYVTFANEINRWLHSADGKYAMLEDSYEPDYYRMAYFKSSGTFQNILGQAVRATITFSCKPQRFLKNVNPIQMTSTTIIQNVTGYETKPLINVVTTMPDAEFDIGDITVKFGVSHGSFYIDCESGLIYMLTSTGSGMNFANEVTFYDKNGIQTWDFPKLSSTDTRINPVKGISSITVTPRWWVL